MNDKSIDILFKNKIIVLIIFGLFIVSEVLSFVFNIVNHSSGIQWVTIVFNIIVIILSCCALAFYLYGKDKIVKGFITSILFAQVIWASNFLFIYFPKEINSSWMPFLFHAIFTVLLFSLFILCIILHSNRSINLLFAIQILVIFNSLISLTFIGYTIYKLCLHFTNIDLINLLRYTAYGLLSWICVSVETIYISSNKGKYLSNKVNKYMNKINSNKKDKAKN